MRNMSFLLQRNLGITIRGGTALDTFRNFGFCPTRPSNSKTGLRNYTKRWCKYQISLLRLTIPFKR